MKNKKITLILGSIALSLGVFAFALNNNSSVKKSVTVNAADYYSRVTDNMSGTTLLDTLNGIINNSSVSVSYDWSRYEDADEDPNNSSNVILIYARNSVKKTAHVSNSIGWNREHTFPQSKLQNSQAESDNHIIFASDNKVNGARSNIKMGVVTGGTIVNDYNGNPTTCRKTSSLFDPNNVSRGKVARSTMYAAAMYGYDPTDNFESIYTMLKWHLDYPVDSFDNGRNEKVYKNQKNRNPFVDHPEYACRIWGDTNSSTKSLCQSAVYPTVDHTVSMRTFDGYNMSSSDVTSYSLKVGDSINFFGFVDNEYSSSVYWELSDTNVVSSQYYSSGSFSNGLKITALSSGTTTLTIKHNYTDGNNETKTVSSSCVITVSESGSSGGESGEIESQSTATYTVNSTTSVTSSGTVPNGSSATYSQTFSTMGQITGGNDAVLTLSGYGGKVITGITLNMKSNSKSGAGSFNAEVGSTSIASTSGNFNAWYDNTSYSTQYKDIVVKLTNSSLVVETNENITLTISATQNSLYINSYTITYGTPSGGETTPTLTSISLNTNNVQTTFEVDDDFSYSGLIVTANYSDNSSKTISSGYTVSTPDMSSEGAKTVTVTYQSKTATYTITVNSSSVTPVLDGDTNFVVSEKNYDDKEVISSAAFDNSNISVAFNKGTNSNDPKYFTSGDAIRVYGGGYFTVTSTLANIYAIQLTFGSGENNNSIAVDSGEYDDGLWMSDNNTYVSSVTFTIGGTSGHRRIAAISVSYYNANMFASDFLDGTGCNSTGSTRPTVNWTNMSSKFNILFTDEQSTLRSAIANKDSTDKIEQAVARYDYIVGKYGTSVYSDFIGRNPAKIGNNRISIFGNDFINNNSQTLIIVVSSLLAVSAFGLYIFIKKKQK